MAPPEPSQKPQTVWVQLYVGQEKRGGAFKIKPIPEDINDLREVVKEKCKIALSHCDAADLTVYASGTAVPVRMMESQEDADEDVPYRPGMKSTDREFPKDTSDEKPLVVVAPPDMQQQQQIRQQQQYIAGELISISKPKKASIIRLSTPSKNDSDSILKKGCIHVERTKLPLVANVPDGYRNPYDKSNNVSFSGENLEELLAERFFYSVASSTAPGWIEASVRLKDAKQNRDALFQGTQEIRRFIQFSKFEPELFTRVKRDRCGTPAYNGEIKSAGKKAVMYDEIANYVLFGIVDSYFTEDDITSKVRIFYSRPPIGYGLMGMAHVGYFVCMELIGKAIITPCSGTFFLGSSEHKAAVQNLNCIDGGEKHTLPCDEHMFLECSKLGDRIVYTGKPDASGKFWKIIRYDAYEAPIFQNLYKVYKRYGELPSEDLMKHHLISAELLFGELEVAVRTQFMENARHGTDEDFKNQVLMEKVAKAIAYLGRNKLLYTDLRPQNILVKGSDQVWLIDYDDIRIQENALTLEANFTAALSEKVDGLPVIPPKNNYMMENNELFATFLICLRKELPFVDLAQLTISDDAPS